MCVKARPFRWTTWKPRSSKYKNLINSRTLSWKVQREKSSINHKNKIRVTRTRWTTSCNGETIRYTRSTYIIYSFQERKSTHGVYKTSFPIPQSHCSTRTPYPSPRIPCPFLKCERIGFAENAVVSFRDVSSTCILHVRVHKRRASSLCINERHRRLRRVWWRHQEIEKYFDIPILLLLLLYFLLPTCQKLRLFVCASA